MSFEKRMLKLEGLVNEGTPGTRRPVLVVLECGSQGREQEEALRSVTNLNLDALSPDDIKRTDDGTITVRASALLAKPEAMIRG